MVPLVDSLSAEATAFKKRFNTLEVQVKERNLKGRDWMATWLHRMNTANAVGGMDLAGPWRRCSVSKAANWIWV